jgi:hypothetical protein
MDSEDLKVLIDALQHINNRDETEFECESNYVVLYVKNGKLVCLKENSVNDSRK